MQYLTDRINALERSVAEIHLLLTKVVFMHNKNRKQLNEQEARLYHLERDIAQVLPVSGTV